MTSAVWGQVSPPSVEVWTKMALSGPVSSKARLVAYTRFPRPKSTHGSVTRWNAPPATIPTPWRGMFCQVWPPSKLVPKTRFRAPPVDQRSSWNIPTNVASVRRVHVHPRLGLRVEENTTARGELLGRERSSDAVVGRDADERVERGRHGTEDREARTVVAGDASREDGSAEVAAVGVSRRRRLGEQSRAQEQREHNNESSHVPPLARPMRIAKHAVGCSSKRGGRGVRACGGTSTARGASKDERRKTTMARQSRAGLAGGTSRCANSEA